MIEEPNRQARCPMQQYQSFHDIIARDHVELLRREARRARLSKARRRRVRSLRWER
jgi:hypothetical protein